MFFNEKNDLVVSTRKSGDALTLIPAKQVKVIYRNLLKGKTWIVASPMYAITREIAAFILVNYKEKKSDIVR